MSKSDAFETDLLELFFQAKAIADLAENDTTTPATNLYVSLHTATPTDTGNQSSNEVSYGAYARQAVARTSAGWAISGDTITPVAAISFPQCTSGTTTAGWAGIGTAATGTGYLMYYGQITSGTISISTGVTPQLTTSSSVTED